MRLLSLSLPFLVILSPLPTLAAGDGTLFTDAVTYCAEAKAVVVDEFDIAYHQSNGSVTFTFSLASVESNLNVSANLYINAYGMEIINQTLNLCDLLEGVICPLPQVNFTGERLGGGMWSDVTDIDHRIWHVSYPSTVHLQNPRYCIYRPQPRGLCACSTASRWNRRRRCLSTSNAIQRLYHPSKRCCNRYRDIHPRCTSSRSFPHCRSQLTIPSTTSLV